MIIKQKHTIRIFLFPFGFWVSFLILLMNSQIFLGQAGNPIGIDGVQESFYMFLLAWMVVSLYKQQRSTGAVRKLDFYVLALTFLPLIYGSVAAKLTYGQPLLFGFIEERRLLALLVYFPVRTMLDRGWVDMTKFETLVITVAVICALLAIGVKIGVVPGFNEIRSSEIALRESRISIGGNTVGIGIAILIGRKKKETDRFGLVWASILVGTILLVFQTRQVILASAVATAFVLRGARAAYLIFAVSFAFYLAILFLPGFDEKVALIGTIFGEAVSSEYLSQSWRAMSYAHVLETLRQGEIWGHGSLSPMWNEGFGTIIGQYFYLADIGIMGTLFRYGLPGLFLYLCYLILQCRILLSLRDRQRRALYGGLFLFLIVGLPVAAPLEYGGYIAGLILGVTGFLIQAQQNRSHS